VIESISVPIELTDREQLIKCAATSLNSKVVSQYSGTIAPMVVDAVLKVQHNGNCDLRDIKVRCVMILASSVFIVCAGTASCRCACACARAHTHTQPHAHTHTHNHTHTHTTTQPHNHTHTHTHTHNR
jgi:ABC-type nickel/cobalt efflux system permease component RcnA